MTMLLGGAKLLKERESELKGTVKLIFQPAEEGGAGGERMVKEGVPPSILAPLKKRKITLLGIIKGASRPRGSPSLGPFTVTQEAGHL